MKFLKKSLVEFPNESLKKIKRDREKNSGEILKETSEGIFGRFSDKNKLEEFL